MKQKLLFSSLLITFFSFGAFPAYAAMPASTNYQLQEYGFGSGGTQNSTSTNYGLFGTAGQMEFGQLSSTNFKTNSGLTFLMKSNVPGTPTFTNPSSNYDRLQFILNTSNNPTDTTYAIAISTDNFASDVRYVKSDGTIGTTLTSADFKTYTNWGGASGSYITSLVANTTYTIKVKAKQGNFTESEYGPTASVATSIPSLTFGISSNNLAFNNLNTSNSFTDTSKITTLTTSTNAYNGYVINGRETAALTNGSATIANYAGTNANPTTWSGTGFGYTTNDADLTGGTNNRFTNGGAKYAGFTTSSPGDPVADHAGPVTTAITNEPFTITYRVTADASQKAGQYTTTILYTVVPSY